MSAPRSINIHYTEILGAPLVQSSLRSPAPDEAALGVTSPGNDGIAILRDRRDARAAAHLPIVMPTAKKDDATTWQGRSAGAVFFMPKPFAPDELTRSCDPSSRKEGPGIG